MKALIVNRVGDVGLSMGIFAIFFVFGAVDYSTVFSTVADMTCLDGDKENLKGAAGPILNFLGFEFDAVSPICFFLFNIAYR